MQLGDVEPEAGKLESLIITPIQNIAIVAVVISQWYALFVTQFGNIPLNGRFGTFKLFGKLVDGNGVTPAV